MEPWSAPSPTCRPSNCAGKPVDHRSDIFSFGAILYEMMAGSRAFRGETEVDTMTAVLREEPAERQIWTKLRSRRDIRTSSSIAWKKIRRTGFQSAKDLVFALQTLSASSPARM